MKGLAFLLIAGFFFHTGRAEAQPWKPYADSAKKYTAAGETEKAIDWYTKAKASLPMDSSQTLTYAAFNYELADLYTAAVKYEQAEALFIEAMELLKKIVGKAHHEYIKSCSGLGIVYAESGRFDKAEIYFLEVRALREKVSGKQNANYASSCNNLASLYLNMGKYEKAEPLYLEAKEIRATLNGTQSPAYASLCYNLGALYYSMGQYEKAESSFLEALQIQKDSLGTESIGYIQTINGLGVLYNVLGDKGKAELFYLETKTIYQQLLGNEHPDYASCCNNLGSLYYSIGQFQKAESLYLEAKQIQEKALGKTHPDYALSCRNLGAVYHVSRQYEKAERYYQEAKNIWGATTGKEHPDYALICVNLAFLYNDLGQSDKAGSLLTEALQIQEKVVGTSHPDYATSCDNLGDFYMETGQYKQAEQLYLTAKQIRQKVLGKQHLEYQVSCASLGHLYWVLQQPLLAEKEFKEVLSVSAYTVSKVFQYTNEQEKQSFLKYLLGTDDKIYSFYLSQKISSEQPYSLSLFHRQLILSSSRSLLKQLFSSENKVIQEKFREWIHLRTSLAALYTAPVEARKEDGKKMEEKANGLEKELTRLSSSFKIQQERQQAAAGTIQRALKPGEASIEFVSFQYHDGKRVTDSIYYAALLLRKDRLAPEMIKLFEERELTHRLRIYKGTSGEQVQLNFLYSKTRHTGSPEAKDLYKLIWQPLEEKLQGIHTVYFAPTGVLFKISFAALPIADNKVVSDKYRLVQLNSTASLTDQSITGITSADKVLLYGGIRYDMDSTAMKLFAKASLLGDNVLRALPDDLERGGIPELRYLEGTGREIRAIHGLGQQAQYNIQINEGVAATEESYKSLGGKNSPAVLHIATHGFFFPDPGSRRKNERLAGYEVFRQSDNPLIRSGLILAGASHAWKGKPVTGVEDGILTSYEISNMYLPNTKLAVLSACETGLGDIQGSEGVYGLQRAFKIAGVENLVMSLWRVDDMASAEFMQAFYRNLFARQTIQDAFYNAQATMKNRYRNDPYRWAAWILIR